MDDRAEAFLVQALDLGLEPLFWFEQAVARGVDAWSVPELTVTGPHVPERRAKNGLGLLGTLAAGKEREPDVRRSLNLLEAALTDERLAERAVEVVSGLSSSAAVRLLGRALERDSTTLHAAKSLYDIARRRAGEVSAEADDVVQHVLGSRSEALFLRALREGEAPRFWFDRARDYQGDTWTILRGAVEDSESAPETAGRAVRLLGELAGDPATRLEALELLRLAMRQERVAAAAISTVGQVAAGEAVNLLGTLLDDKDLGERVERTLKDLAGRWSTPPELQRHANNTLLNRPVVPAPTSPMTQGERLDAADQFSKRDWDRLLRSIAEGRCLPVLGQDLSPSLTSPRTIARQWATEYDYPMSGQVDLPDVAQFLQTTLDRTFLVELIARIYRSDSVPATGIHAVLARLPLPIYLTFGYDELLQRALNKAGKRPHVGFFDRLDGVPQPFLPDDQPSDAESLVYHLYGHRRKPDSLVITEEDVLVVVREASGISRMGPFRGAAGARGPRCSYWASIPGPSAAGCCWSSAPPGGIRPSGSRCIRTTWRRTIPRVRCAT
jgi:hypothetical protein